MLDNLFPPSWISGLWHREYLLEIIERIWYNHSSEKLWGTDYLTCLPVVLNQDFVYTDATKFIKQTIASSRDHHPHQLYKERLRNQAPIFNQSKMIYRTEVERANLPQTTQAELFTMANDFAISVCKFDRIKIWKWKLISALQDITGLRIK